MLARRLIVSARRPRRRSDRVFEQDVTPLKVLVFVRERVRWPVREVLVGTGALFEGEEERPVGVPAVWVHVLLPWWAWVGCGLVHRAFKKKLWDAFSKWLPWSVRRFIVVE